MPEEIDKPKIPAEAGQILVKPKDDEKVVSKKEQSKYRTGVGKLLHMMQWLRLDILNPTRKLSKHLTKATTVHMKALYGLMTNCLATEKRGLKLAPNQKWNGMSDHKFNIIGKADSTYASCPNT